MWVCWVEQCLTAMSEQCVCSDWECAVLSARSEGCLIGPSGSEQCKIAERERCLIARSEGCLIGPSGSEQCKIAERERCLNARSEGCLIAPCKIEALSESNTSMQQSLRFEFLRLNSSRLLLKLAFFGARQMSRIFALAIQGLFKLDSDRILKNTKHYLLSKVRK